MSASVPEVTLDAGEANCVDAIKGEFGELALIEAAALRREALPARAAGLASLRKRILEAWAQSDHAVLRNVPATNDGSTGLVLALLTFAALKPYRGSQVVKHFRMSPWTTALSQTTASGFFHTDINTAVAPPAASIIQCLDADPGAPEFGQLRVARVSDLLLALRTQGQDAALRFLTADQVTMLNETSPEGWTGTIMEEGRMRFHPESLRAAAKRFGTNPPNLETLLTSIHEAALGVSVPISLAPGDVLIVSNLRALHQRGACTVRFREFPMDFESRRVAVLHALGEPA